MKFKAATALGIDITNGMINMALLKSGKNSVKLLKAASAPVPEGVIKNGNIEDAAVFARAVKKLKTKSRIGSHPTAMSLVANPMLMQILEIPYEISGGVKQFVRDEVKHYAVLPRTNVALDYCGLKAFDKSGNRRALVVATDGQKITDAARAMNKKNLNIEHVEPASVAYIRACYAKKIARKFDSNLLFAITDDNTFTICLFRNQTLDFIRTKGIAGDDFYQGLAEEINAVIQFYELQLGEKCGNWEVTVVTDKDAKLIGQHLLPGKIHGVELKVVPKEDAYIDTPLGDKNYKKKPSAVAVGLAMKLLNLPDSGLNINLLPPEVAEVKSVVKQTMIVANVAAALFFLMMLGTGFLSMRVKEINADIAKKNPGPLFNEMKILVGRQTLLDKKIANLYSNLDSITTALAKGSVLRWGAMLDDIAIAIPKKVWITELESRNNSKISLQGKAVSYEAVHLFVEMLNNCKYIESATLAKTINDEKTYELIRYSIDCSLIQ